ncbi:MAG: capsule biosynthesis protein, partial [Candidatus Omnitrophota bacterium]
MKARDLPKKIFKKIRNRVIPRTDWHKILKAPSGISWARVRLAAQTGPLILIATGTGGHGAVTPVESLLAAALTIRGARVHFLLCDKFLPACLQATAADFKQKNDFVRRGPTGRLCPDCYAQGKKIYAPLGLTTHRYSEWITPDEAARAASVCESVAINQIKDYQFDGIRVGEHSMAGALRYFARGDLDGEPEAELVLRRFFRAGLMSYFALRRLLSENRYCASVFHHGIYIPQGILGEIARSEGVRVVNWNIAYRKRRLLFSHGDTYHHTLMQEPCDNWENVEWSPILDGELDRYLKSRWTGSRDWIGFHEKPEIIVDDGLRQKGIDFSKPLIGMLTNVVWDAQLHYPGNVFPDMMAWVRATIRYFNQRPELQLLIRVHPAEIRGTPRSRQRVEEEVRSFFSELPNNVFIIGAKEALSTYAAMKKCSAVIIYGTKTGVELTADGIPVVTAGEAWVKNKEITFDAKNQKEYFSLLDKMPNGLAVSSARTLRARKYAYHFFFRRMIPVKSVAARPDWPPIRV